MEVPPAHTLPVQLVSNQLANRHPRNKALLAKVLDQSPDPLIPLGRHPWECAEMMDRRGWFPLAAKLEQFVHYD